MKNKKIMNKTPAQKAQILLGFERGDLELKVQNPVLRALILAIIASDDYRVIRVTKSDTNVKLDQFLNDNLILPIHLAAYIGNEKIIGLILDKGQTTINISTIDDMSPLMYAVLSGNLSAVQLLCAQGANHAAKNRDEITAKDLAKEHGHPDIYEFLDNLEHQNRIPAKAKL